MANGEEKNNDFYAVLGLNKECTPTELRTAYKKLALRWHPDRCSASGNSKFVEEAKKKFQAIQQAYSVLSDSNKRFLYDVGAYDSDDDENGMGDFLNEMAGMMSQTKSNENGGESFEELQELFEEMFQADIDSFESTGQSTPSCSASSSFGSYGESSSSNKRNSSEMSSVETRLESSSSFDAQFHSFCLGVEHRQDIKQHRGARGGMRGAAGGSRRRNGRKQKVSSGHDVTSNDCGISAS
ncbi:PREDICTED: dnaJ homolog subfamily B member 8 isoform X1 [Theobroma cacao]|uniref:DnaJ homolog subfamily B member 8 isoform X1 n=2 Tax=Theobroma cacao TaxID=3641 RepID=A0AB32UZV6_THECC|nr:PREDICTED: dnaJ homolog subfamily B member 8 isoform X1 [Theobroma cacao]XP_017979296.1 PREDICTED: dnaJ homolog subfamily B member 8 isoform X1 [Theobroma cacao]EOY27349.1 Chaperone DnaJ-domain containing protein isoform 3 [Theobroma cacao]